MNFKNAIIIMTSNLMGTRNAQTAQLTAAERKQELLNALRQHLRPEFVNRIDEVIEFQALSQAEIAQVVTLQLQRVEKMLAAQGFAISWTPAAVEKLAQLGYDPQFGARPVKRAIQEHVLNALSRALLSETVSRDKPITIDAENGEIVFK